MPLAILALFSSSALAKYRSGEVKTYETFKYGKFETRMLPSSAKGTVSSFFTYWDGPNWYEAGWNEIDVEVVPTMTDNGFSTNLIYGDGHSKK